MVLGLSERRTGSTELTRYVSRKVSPAENTFPVALQHKCFAGQTGFQFLIDRKDEHFGNARLARNVFEKSIRRMASRIVSIAPLTKELLTTLEPQDIHMDGVPFKKQS